MSYVFVLLVFMSDGVYLAGKFVQIDTCMEVKTKMAMDNPGTKIECVVRLRSGDK